MKALAKPGSALAVLVAASLILSLFACGGGAPAARLSTNETEGDTPYAPDFVLEDLGGNVVRLSDYSGQVRLVDFWATWCAPCREEIPMFKELHETYGGQGFTMVAVSMDEEGANLVREFVQEYDIPYINLMGNDQVAQDFGGVFGLPTAFLLDGEGRIVDQYLGAKPRKVLEKKIRELLGLEPSA